MIVEQSDLIYTLEDFPRLARQPGEPVDFSILPITAEFEQRMLALVKGTQAEKRLVDESTALQYGAYISNGYEVERSDNDYYVGIRLATEGATRDEVATCFTHPTWFVGSKARTRGRDYLVATVTAIFNEIERIQQEKVRSHTKTGKFNPAIAAENYADCLFMRSYEGQEFFYLDGKYKTGIEIPVISLLRDSMGSEYRTKHKDEVLKQIRDLVSTRPADPEPSKVWVNFQNGLYNTETRQFVEHTPSVFTPNYLAVQYTDNPDKGKTAAILSQLESTLRGDENIPVFLEIVGHALTTAMIEPVLMFLQGPGRSGKSELLHLVMGLIGAHNSSHVDIVDLTSDATYYAYNTLNMLANIVFDTVAERGIKNPSRAKSLYSAERTPVRKIFGQPVMARITAKYMAATNKPVSVANTDSGWRRRVITLPCPKPFDPHDEGSVYNIGQRHAADPEAMSALAFLALQARERLWTNKTFTRTVSIEAERRESHINDDPVAAVFLEDCEDAPGYFMSSRVFKMMLAKRIGDDSHRHNIGPSKIKQRAAELSVEYKDVHIEAGRGYDEEKQNTTTGFFGRRPLHKQPTFKVVEKKREVS